jgi:hypothetical protein
MLKELNAVWLQARRQVAAWRRWSRKQPHNRVRRQRLRDERGRPVGYGPPEPVPEPALPLGICQAVRLPSGRVEMVWSGGCVETTYRLARHPKQTPGEVVPLPLSEDEIRRRYEQYCRR